MPELPSRILSLILSALTYGPDTIADRALRWMLSRPASLRSGDPFETSEWEPARRLLHRFCRRCSDAAYAEVEDFLLHYTDADERRSMILRHERVREGGLGYPNRRGQTQYHLLPALPRRRKSAVAAGLEGVLQRKFTPHKDSMFNSHRSRGGFVTSPMRAEPHRLSDLAWLRLIANNAEKDGPHSMRYYADHCTEASPSQFAGDLGCATRRDPERFARLAPRIPADANPVYLNAILNGLADKKPPEIIPEDVRKVWIAPPLAVLDPVIRDTLRRRDPSHAGALCHVLRERSELPWPSDTIEGVLRLAMAEGPTDSSTLVRSPREEAGPSLVNDLEQRSINCLRGEIAWTIESLLWGDVERLPLVRPMLKVLVTDPDPAVRVASIGACGPVWNVDKDLTAGWFAEACAHEDDRVMACHEASHLIGFIARSHPEAAHAVIRRMIGSSHPEVAKAGAAHATSLWICKGQLETEARHCLAGRVELRRGAALAAAVRASGDDYSPQALEILLPLLDDPDDEVRNEVGHIFQSHDLLSRRGILPFLQAYIRSRSFRKSQWLLMHALKEHAGSLLPLADLLMGAVEMAANPLLDASRDPTNSSSHVLSEIAPLLIRLYEQAEGASQTDIRERCLDAWDLLLERRVGIARTLTSAMDR